MPTSAQHDHLFAGSGRQGVDRRADPAGLLPAAILTACNLAAAYLVAIKRGYPAGTFPGWDAVWRSLAAAAPGLFVVVIIVTGILSGVFTATESASVAVI